LKRKEKPENGHMGMVMERDGRSLSEDESSHTEMFRFTNVQKKNLFFFNL